MKKIIDAGLAEHKISYVDGLVFAEMETPLCGGTMNLEMAFVRPMFSAPDVKRPVILWVPGGAWAGSYHKSWLPEFVSFAKHGYILAATNYRVTSEAVFPAQIIDIQTAVRFIRANADKMGADPDKIAIFGCSAGGHLTALAAMNPDKYEAKYYPEVSSDVQAAIDMYGPTDLNLMYDESIRKSKEPRRMGPPPGEAFFMPPRTKSTFTREFPANTPESMLVGGPVPEMQELAYDANPINHIGDKTCPILILHGDCDTTVPIKASELLYDALEKAGRDVEMYTVKGAEHSSPEFSQQCIKDIMIDFLDRKLDWKCDK